MARAGMMLMMGLAGAQAADPVPTPWPDQFYTVESKNGTDPEGNPHGYEASTKYYDWSREALRQTCSVNDVTSTFLVFGIHSWVFNKENQHCTYLRLPVTPVKPDWMLGGNYTGEQVINGRPSYCWEKMGHMYCESKYNQQPTRVFTPLDQKGWANREDYGVFLTGPSAIASADWEIPSYCPNFSIPIVDKKCPNPPPKSDPACCFLPLAFPSPPPPSAGVQEAAVHPLLM